MRGFGTHCAAGVGGNRRSDLPSGCGEKSRVRQGPGMVGMWWHADRDNVVRFAILLKLR